MTSIRWVRISANRLYTNLFRGEISCTSAICFTVLIFFFLSIAINTKRTQTVMTSLDNAKLILKDIEGESESTILIEQDDGNIYIAFKMKDSANIVKQLKSGKKDVKHSNKKSETSHVLGKSHENNLRKVNSKSDRIKIIGNGELSSAIEVSFPLTVLKKPYNINNELVCYGLKELSFIVVVHSATTHFMRRSSIRETWANFKLFKRHSMRIIFLLGKPERESTQALIEHESAVNKDIIQGMFVDSYRNLTHKGVLGLRWISEFCKQANIVVKVDDDVFLNVFKLMEELETNFRNKTRQIWCPVRRNGTSLIQRGKGKWKIDENEFRNMTYFPVTYCNGFFTVLTRDIIKDMYEAAKVTPFFWVDDVYLFGLLTEKIKNVKHVPLLNLNLNERDAIECFESKTNKCQLLVANAHSDGIMDKFWFRALEQYKTLAQKYSNESLFV